MEIFNLANMPFFYASLCAAFILFFDKIKTKGNDQTFLFINLFLIIVTFFFVQVVFPSYKSIAIYLWFAFLSAFIQLIITLIWDHKNWRAHVVSLLLFLAIPLLTLTSHFFLYHNITQQTPTKDQLLYAVDATLGMHPNFLCEQLFVNFPLLLQKLITVNYVAITTAFAVVYTLIPSEQSQLRNKLFVEFLAIGIIGYFFYHIIPGCGALNFFGTALISSPPQPLSAPNIFIKPSIPGLYPCNCLPSLHTSWILCVWRYLWLIKPKWRVLGSIWAVVSLFGAVVVGQHYLIDIVVGFAFALTLQSIFAGSIPWSHPLRLISFYYGVSVFIGWYLLILFGIDFLRISVFIPRFLYLFSLIATFLLIYKLSNYGAVTQTKAVMFAKEYDFQM